MKIGILQYDIIWESVEKNKKKITEKFVSFFKTNEADWILLPEFALSGFSLDKSKTNLCAADIDFFKELAVKYSVAITFGVILNDYNTAITIDASGAKISDYSKMHLFSVGGEHNIYKAGSEHKIFKLNGFHISPAICYDLRFSYLFWDNALNTDIYFIIANWPAERMHHWQTLLAARAIENQAYVIGVNRTGNAPAINYSGGSVVYSPTGIELLNCKSEENIFTVIIDKQIITDTRNKFGVLADRCK